MANGPHNIVVKVDVDTGCHKVSETTKFSVDATCVSTVTVPGNGKAVEVNVMPAPDGQPAPLFLMVQPYELGGQPIKPDLLLLSALNKNGDGFLVEVAAQGDQPAHYVVWWGDVEYSTTKDNDDQRKPLHATHVFFAGQTEWVTDMVKKSGPGPLCKLFFWNNLTAKKYPKEKGKDKPDDLAGGEVLPADKLAIKIQIVTGYTPIPENPAAGPKYYRKA